MTDIDEVIPWSLLRHKQILEIPVPPWHGSSAENERVFLDLDFAYTGALLAVGEERPLVRNARPNLNRGVNAISSVQELRHKCAQPY